MDKIRVGLIGTGKWTRYGHIPALRALDDFEIVAIVSRTLETAQKVAADFDIPYALDDEQALLDRADIDLIVVLTPAMDHARLVRRVIAAGKDVYSEWPLSTTTAESEELVALAQKKGVRHIVGLQRRFGASTRYLGALVAQGYIGEMRSASLTVGTNAFPDHMSSAHKWSFDIANFGNTLSVYGGHFGDVLFNTVGFPKVLTAIVRNQFPVITVSDTGEKVPTSRPDAAMAIGTLQNGALFSFRIEGGQSHRTGLQIDITGTEGVLRVTNSSAFQNVEDNAILGMKGDEDRFTPIPVPAEYRSLANAGLDSSQQDVAYLYSAYADDRENGTSTASSFIDAVRQHRVIDRMREASDATFG